MNKKKITKFHRDNILIASDKLFLKNGFDGTTIEMIAKESDYSKPTLYVYFKSKEEIFACNLYQRLTDFSERIDSAIISKGDVVETYLECCHIITSFKKEFPVYFEGIIGNVSLNSVMQEKDVVALIELQIKINENACVLVERAKKEGVISDKNSTAFVYNYIWSAVMGVVSSAKLRKECRGNETEYMENLDKCFISIIRGIEK